MTPGELEEEQLELLVSRLLSDGASLGRLQTVVGTLGKDRGEVESQWTPTMRQAPFGSCTLKAS